MSQTINKIKTRIRTVTGAYKVTSAMKLVSTSKLQSWKSKMIANKRYAEEVNNASASVFAHIDDVESALINGNNNVNKNLYIIVTSSLGLCGAYNSNVFALVDPLIKDEDDAIILGKKGRNYYRNAKFNKITEFNSYESIKDASTIRAISDYMIRSYAEGKYKEVHLIYTEYLNPITFKARDHVLLPFKNDVDTTSEVGYGPLLEPSKEELINTLIPFVVQTLTYSKLLESEVSEQASRSNAMDNATENAEELLDELHIEYNKARQASITQEIVEIAAAANALYEEGE